MKKYAFVVESGADLPREYAAQHNIEIAPMHVSMGGVDYPDDGSLSLDELFAYHEKTGKLPSTSAVNPDEYLEIYQRIRAKNPEAIIMHIVYSAVTTATFQNAQIAAKGFENIYMVDSQNVSGGQGFIVMKIVELVEEHPEMTPEEIVAAVEAHAKRTRFSFLPGSLEYLRAGGRVSNAQYLGATVLKLKPLIELKDGYLVSTKKYRGTMKDATLQMIREYFSTYKINKKKILLVNAWGLDEDIRSDMEKTVKDLGVEEFMWIKTGCVISTHSGPKGVGIVGLED